MMARAPWRRMGLVIAVLAAVAVRLLTPAGWMPNPDGARGSLFVICTGQGPRLAGGLDLPSRGPDHRAPQDHCLFAGFSLAGGPDAAAIPAPPQRIALHPGQPVLRRALWRRREKHSPQSPRAPPLEI